MLKKQADEQTRNVTSENKQYKPKNKSVLHESNTDNEHVERDIMGIGEDESTITCQSKVYESDDTATKTSDEAKYVPLIFENYKTNDLTQDELKFYQTIEKTRRVYVEERTDLNDNPMYVCEIIAITVSRNRSIRYHLKYDKNEPGVKRSPFWFPY
mgnify:CR=1 FL=1